MRNLYNKKSSKVFNQVSEEQREKLLHLYLPPRLTDDAIRAALQAAQPHVKFRPGKDKPDQLDTPAMLVNVKLFFTYLNKVFYRPDRNSATWVGVRRDDRRTLLGIHYNEVIDALLVHELLERQDYNKDGRYFPNGYCRFGDVGLTKSYRAHLDVLVAGTGWRHETTELTQALRRKLGSLGSKQKNTTEHYRALTHANMSLLILLDTPECRAAIVAMFARYNTQISPEEFIQTFNNYPFQEEPNVDDFGGRLHHEVVRLHKSLRPFLRFRDHLDEQVVELDLVASQPSFLANITPQLIEKYAPECSAAIPFFEQYSQRKDYREYQRHCIEGTIYEHLRDKFNELFGGSLVTPVTRDDAKNIFYTAAFSNYRFREKSNNPASLAATETRLNKYVLSGQSEKAAKASAALFKKRSYHLFKHLFPSLHELFTDLKALNWKFNPGDQHSNNCLLAQRIESGIVYTHLVKSLVDGNVERFTTTHDSLNVMQCDEKLARKLVTRALKQAGLQMNLKEKKATTASEPVAIALVEASLKIEPKVVVDELVVPFCPVLDAWGETPVKQSATVPSSVPLTDEQMLEILERQEREQAANPMSDEEFFGW